MPLRDELDRLRFDLHTALEGESVWQACVKMLDRCLHYHSCSLLIGIENFQAAEARHHVVAGDYFNYGSAKSVSVSESFLRRHPRVKLYTYREVLETDPEAPRRRQEKEVTLSAWDHFVHLVYWNGQAPDALFSVRRTAAQGDFSVSERKFLGRLHADLGAALHRLRKLRGERSQQAVVQQFLANLPLPVLFLDERRKLSFATQEAYELCVLWNHGPAQARALNPRTSFRLPAQIVAACRQLIEPPATGSATSQEIRVDHPTVAGMSATISRRTPERGPSSCITLVVTFCRSQPENRERDARPDALRWLNLLTPSERQVARLVAGGEKNQDVARQLGKSLRTVEFQLNVIYRKFGIQSRSQLTRLLA